MANIEKTYNRVISTGLALGDTEACEIINSVVGQISDGIWENSNRAWPFAYFAWGTDTGANIKVSESHYHFCRISDSALKNPYHKMSDSQVLEYFARKIKEIALVEMEDDYERDIMADIMNHNSYGKDWTKCLIFHDSEEERKEYEQLYEKYKRFIEKHPFSRLGKFKASEREMSYLNSDMNNVYRVYKALLRKASEIRKHEHRFAKTA